MDWGLFWTAVAAISAGMIALLEIERRLRPSRPPLKIDATFSRNPGGWIDCRLTIRNLGDDPVLLKSVSVARPSGWLCGNDRKPDHRGGFLPAEPKGRVAEIGLLVQPGERKSYDLSIRPPARSISEVNIDIRCVAICMSEIATSKSWIVRRSASASPSIPKD